MRDLTGIYQGLSFIGLGIVLLGSAGSTSACCVPGARAPAPCPIDWN
jgi:uncharacterized membrane protein